EEGVTEGLASLVDIALAERPNGGEESGRGALPVHGADLAPADSRLQVSDRPRERRVLVRDRVGRGFAAHLANEADEVQREPLDLLHGHALILEGRPVDRLPLLHTIDTVAKATDDSAPIVS